MRADPGFLRDATFLDALLRAEDVEERGFTFLSADLEESPYSFRALVAEARKRGRHLQKMGLKKGDRLAMVIPESEDFVLTFLGAVSVGVVPVPMYPPLALGKLDGYMETAERILSTSRARVLVTTKKVAPILWSLAGKAKGLEDIITVDRLAEPAPFDGEPVSVSPSDPCFLQFTSGSTSDPKGVVVTHSSLIHNARAIMFDGLDSEPTKDKGVSWLPLYHDMGLIGFVLSPIVAHVPVVFIQTMSFVKRPTVWMDTVSKYKGTITFAPNFAFALAAKYAERNKKPGFDVSSLRVVGCGAEPINAGTLRKFQDAFGPSGLSENAIMPCYGMAEATLAMSFDPLTQPYSSVRIDREAYENDNLAKVVNAEAQGSVELVACGRTFPGHQIGIMSPEGKLCGDGVVGELVFSGPSVANGYFENPEASANAIKNGWLHTGDLGFMIDGVVYISGRMKDLIILNGRNYHPQAIEWEVEQIDGIRKGNVVAFAVRGEETEKLVIVAESRKDADVPVLSEKVKDAVKNALGLSVHEVMLVPPGGLPKTSSGKLQRRKTRAGFESGALGRENRTLGSSATKATVARHLMKSTISKLRHRVGRVTRVLRPQSER
ncbi:MAG: fatty acyl-AMP ligase [Myxococcota bacterium]